MNNTNPYVSVVIPVYNDSERLRVCLRALQEQTYPHAKYEVIVVDNNSEESIEEVVYPFSQAILTSEKKSGSYAARNRGISVAKGEVLAFTDSDCIPAANWLETGVSNLLSVPNCGLVGGKIEIFFKNPNCPTTVEVYDSIMHLQQKRYVEICHYGATANVFTLRKVFDKVGMFDSNLRSGGDREWGERVFNQGFQLVYADDCWVAHPARYSIGQLIRKVIRISQGPCQLLQTKEEEKHFLNQLIEDLSWLRPPLRSTFKRLFLRKESKNTRHKIKVFFLSLLIHYAYHSLCFKEKIKLRFNITKLNLSVGAK